MLTEDKTSHLSHVILSALKKATEVRLVGDEAKALREIKRVLADELAQEDAVDRIVRSKLASYSRPIVEGSSEWETLYRKTSEEELRKRRKSTP
jgi:hypothetical protein